MGLSKLKVSRGLNKGYYLFLVIMAAAFLLSRADGLNSLLRSQSLHLKNQENYPAHGKLLLFIIDFGSFICPSCLDSFLEFYHAVADRSEEAVKWGILVFDRPEKSEGRPAVKIIEKKLRGFIMANDIRFPIIIDSFHVFEGAAKQGTAVVLFDWRQKIVKKYVFPLKPEQTEEILSLLKSHQ